MRALVIGGTGFIGRWISRQLVEAGHDVVVLHRGKAAEDTLPRGVTSVISDGALSTRAPYEAALRAGEPDAVIHVLAMAEADAVAAKGVLAGRAGRVVVLSSGDVYRAYGRFIRSEPGPVEPTPLDAHTSPLRDRLYPYRKADTPPDADQWRYDKIPVERLFMAAAALPAAILRLPKVFGPGNNADLATVYGFAHHPEWRWTHGYVEDVAAAAVLAATHPAATGRAWNVGEAVTPTVAERLAILPKRTVYLIDGDYDFDQDIAYDTDPIRRDLGYREPVGFEEGVRRSLGAAG